MKHKVKVVILPKILENGREQHLYVTVSQDVEPIKEGDWVDFPSETQINSKIVKLERLFDDKTRVVYCNGGFTNCANKCRKIIATTDPKLRITVITNVNGNTSVSAKPLPQPQQSFLKEYVNNPDGEYEVEYEEISRFEILNMETKKSSTLSTMYEIKLNQDNTVNITSVKEKMYSRKNVKNLLKELSNDIDGQFYHNFKTEDWIEEKL
jgi:hypothetical protein